MSKRSRKSRGLESKVVFVKDCNLNIYPGEEADIIYRCNECDYEIELFNENLELSWQMHKQETYHFETIDRKRELEQKDKKERHRNQKNDKTDEKSDETEERWCRRRVVSLNANSYCNGYPNLSQPKWCNKSDVRQVFDMFPSVKLINNWGYEEVMKAEKEKLKHLRSDIILESLENAVGQIYTKKFTVKFFGSRVTGLATEITNDLDVFIDTEGDLTNDEYRQNLFLTNLEKIFKKGKKKNNTIKIDQLTDSEKSDTDDKPFTHGWVNAVYIKNTRTPIIKVRHTKCDMSCDISVKNGLSVINTELLKSLFHHVPIIRQIIIILRIWFKKWQCTKKFSNYAISLMTIFYLQNEKILPPVYVINKECVKLKNEKGWPIYDYTTHEEFKTLKMNEKQMSLTEHLYKFFKFYASFNYEMNMICPYMGYPVKRLDFRDDGVNLPDVMVDYKRFVSDPNNEECL